MEWTMTASGIFLCWTNLYYRPCVNVSNGKLSRSGSCGHNKEDKRGNYIYCCCCCITKKFFFSFGKKKKEKRKGKWLSTPLFFFLPCFFFCWLAFEQKVSRRRFGHTPKPKTSPVLLRFFSFFWQTSDYERVAFSLFFFIYRIAQKKKKKNAFARFEEIKWNFISRFGFLSFVYSIRPTWLLFRVTRKASRLSSDECKKMSQSKRDCIFSADHVGRRWSSKMGHTDRPSVVICLLFFFFFFPCSLLDFSGSVGHPSHFSFRSRKEKRKSSVRARATRCNSCKLGRFLRGKGRSLRPPFDPIAKQESSSILFFTRFLLPRHKHGPLCLIR